MTWTLERSLFDTAVVETDPTLVSIHLITATRKSIFSVIRVTCEGLTVDLDNWWYLHCHHFCLKSTECSILVRLGSNTQRRHSGVIIVLCIIKLLGEEMGVYL